tara:strand:- start:647 stop:874 length:228 start_codon:yes stop_codon:yes gene_type:complete
VQKLLHAIPVIGWCLRDLKTGGESAFTFFLVNCGLLWILSAVFFGYPGIIIPALCAVPVMFVLLILLTRGRYEVE